MAVAHVGEISDRKDRGDSQYRCVAGELRKGRDEDANNYGD